MDFITPLAFFLTILLPIVIAMYLLKLRRTELVISSTYLWQRMVRDLEANAPWQRLRRNLLLLLQILILLALIFALARPFSWTNGSSSQAVILVFDTSASMAATDLKPNRLESAKDQARLLISNLPQDATCTIIEASDRTKVLISSSQDRRLIYEALDSLKPQLGSSDLSGAIELASAIANRQMDTEIFIYSDGRVKLPKQLAIHDQIRYFPIGESGNNQAISMLNMESGNTEESMTAFVQVVNYGGEPVQRRLSFRADNKLVDAQDIEIPAMGQLSVISEIIPKETITLEATLSGSDDLFLDDKAWTIQQNSRIQNVLLISQGNHFLETALGLLPGINSSTQSFEDVNSEIEDDLSLVIYDSYLPPNSSLRSPNLLYIGPISSTNNFSITGLIENPVAHPISDNDPILSYVDLRDVSILDAANIPLPEWARPVIINENTGEPLLFVGESDGHRIAVIAFDLRRSDFPLKSTYPIFIANLIDWLLPGRLGDIPAQVIPGQALTFTPPPEFSNLTAIHPDGSRTNIDIKDGRANFADTFQLGVYQVTWGENQSLFFAVNLFDLQESNILPIKNLPIIDGNSSQENDIIQQARREWWQPLAMLALVILVIEWLVYNRSTLIKVKDQITNNIKQIFKPSTQ